MGSAVRIVRMPSGRKPGSLAWIVHSARTRRPVVISSTTDARTSTITSTPRSRSLCPPIARAPSRRPRTSASAPLRVVVTRGARPKASAVTSVSTAAKPRTRRSSPGVAEVGRFAGTSCHSSGTTRTATRTPSAPPSAARTRLSVASWRTSRSRPAPMAVRTASSCRRASARARRRFARFAHTIRSTHSAAPLSARTIVRDCCDSSSRKAFTVTSIPSFSFGYCCRDRAATTFISMRADDSVTPGFRRPMP